MIRRDPQCRSADFRFEPVLHARQIADRRACGRSSGRRQMRVSAGMRSYARTLTRELDRGETDRRRLLAARPRGMSEAADENGRAAVQAENLDGVFLKTTP